MAQGKRYNDATKRFDRAHFHGPGEALDLVKSLATAKFDESIDVSLLLGVDPRKADQIVRGTVALPAGTGKDVRVAVFAGFSVRRLSEPPDQRAQHRLAPRHDRHRSAHCRLCEEGARIVDLDRSKSIGEPRRQVERLSTRPRRSIGRIHLVFKGSKLHLDQTALRVNELPEPSLVIGEGGELLRGSQKGLGHRAVRTAASGKPRPEVVTGGTLGWSEIVGHRVVGAWHRPGLVHGSDRQRSRSLEQR